jgi:hypothetical protein
VFNATIHFVTMGLEQAAIFAFSGPSIKIAARHSRHLQHDHFMLRSIEKVLRNSDMIVAVSCPFLIE